MASTAGTSCDFEQLRLDTAGHHLLQELKQTNSAAWEKDLSKHKTCTSDTPCRLVERLEWLDQLAHVPSDSDFLLQIKDHCKHLVEGIAQKITAIDARFECKVFSKGSSVNDTKIARPDEFDFLLELVKFPVSEDNGIFMKTDSRKPEAALYLGDKPQDLQSCYQLLIEDPQTCLAGEDFLEHIFPIGYCISANKIRQAFQNILTIARNELGDFIVPAEKAETYLLWDTDDGDLGPLLVKIPNVDFLVKVDINPCFRAGIHHLVPKARPLNTWQVGNEDPVELETPTKRKQHARFAQVIRLFKVLNDMTYMTRLMQTGRKQTCNQEISIHPPCFVLVQRSNDRRCLIATETSSLLNWYIAQCHHGHRSFLSCSCSRAIMGTVAKIYRQHPGYPTCRLLLEALANFQFIDQRLMPLVCYTQKVIVALRHCAHSVESVYNIQTVDSKEDLLLHLPPWYTSKCSFNFTFPGCEETCFSWPIQTEKSEASPGAMYQSYNDSVTIYRIKASELCICLQVDSTWQHRIQTKLKRELQKTSACTDFVYLAVMSHNHCELCYSKIIWPAMDANPSAEHWRELVQEYVKRDCGDWRQDITVRRRHARSLKAPLTTS